MIQRTFNCALPRFAMYEQRRDARFNGTERVLQVRTLRAANFPNVQSVQLTRNTLPDR